MPEPPIVQALRLQYKTYPYPRVLWYPQKHTSPIPFGRICCKEHSWQPHAVTFLITMKPIGAPSQWLGMAEVVEVAHSYPVWHSSNGSLWSSNSPLAWPKFSQSHAVVFGFACLILASLSPFWKVSDQHWDLKVLLGYFCPSPLSFTGIPPIDKSLTHLIPSWYLLLVGHTGNHIHVKFQLAVVGTIGDRQIHCDLEAYDTPTPRKWSFQGHDNTRLGWTGKDIKLISLVSTFLIALYTQN